MSDQERGAAATADGAPIAPEAAGEPGRGTRLFRSGRASGPGPGWLRGHRWLAELAVLAGFVAAGVLATWPRATYLAGSLPMGIDQSQYVWSMWWTAHQLVHLGNPWHTAYLAAPAGIPLGYDTLMPLLGVVMAPVTLLFGPSASYNLLAIVMPGLACYAMYRLARLWLPGWIGPVAAGAFYGLSGMVAFQDWKHIHTAAGCVFLPLAMAAAIRLRRDATIRRGVMLGLVIGAALLVDQEFAVLAAVLAALVLLPWLLRQGGRAQWLAVAAGALTALVVAAGQLIAMAQEAAAAGSVAPSAGNYIKYSAQLPGLFAPSPRLALYGATWLGSIYSAHAPGDAIATFGLTLTALAVLGLVVSWRRRSARLLGLLWLGSALLALGPQLYVGGHRFVPLAQHWRGLAVSLLMPYTWLIRLPGLLSFREADRLALLGLVGAALLAGAAVEWLRQHARPVLIAAVVLGALEAGWPGSPNVGTMPSTLRAVDHPIAADRSNSVVVDVPFGIVGIPREYGNAPSPLALVLATADGHPRAVSYGPLAVSSTVRRIRSHAFYTGLVTVRFGQPVSPAQLAAARQDLRTLHIGWVLVWQRRWMQEVRVHTVGDYDYAAIGRYLRQTGFHLDYQADGVMVYRP